MPHSIGFELSFCLFLALTLALTHEKYVQPYLYVFLFSSVETPWYFLKMIFELMSNSVVAQKLVFSVGFNCDCCSHVSSHLKKSERIKRVLTV